VQVSGDLQQARVFYTALGDDQAQRTTARALDRATPFLRRQIGARLRLKRVPEVRFLYDRSIAGQDRIEQLLHDIHTADHGPDATGQADGRTKEWNPDTSDDDQS
jgi:ribosome-binding factor A